MGQVLVAAVGSGVAKRPGTVVSAEVWRGVRCSFRRGERDGDVSSSASELVGASVAFVSTESHRDHKSPTS